MFYTIRSAMLMAACCSAGAGILLSLGGLIVYGVEKSNASILDPSMLCLSVILCVGVYLLTIVA